MVIINEPFRKIGKGELGEIQRPFVEVLFFAKGREVWLPVAMLVDSGADYTMLPSSYAELLSIDCNRDCTPIITSGIGGSETVYIYRSQKIKINKWEYAIPIGFLERDSIPPLLGRLHCLEVLEVIFKKHRTILKNNG